MYAHLYENITTGETTRFDAPTRDDPNAAKRASSDMDGHPVNIQEIDVIPFSSLGDAYENVSEKRTSTKYKHVFHVEGPDTAVIISDDDSVTPADHNTAARRLGARPSEVTHITTITDRVVLDDI